MNASPKNKRAFSALLVLATLLLGSNLALAKKRVVVLDFNGPQASKAEAAVVAAVKKKHTVISASQYDKAKKRLKAKKTTDKNVAKIAAEIQVDAVVSGVIKRKGAKWALTVTVREGLSGKVKGKATIPLRAAKIDAKAKKDIGKRVPALVGKTRSISGDGEASDDDDSGDEDVADEDSDDDSGDEVADEDSDDSGEEEVAMADEDSEDSGSSGKKKPAARETSSSESSPADDDEPVPGIDDEREKKTASRGGSDDDVSSVSATAETGLGSEPDGDRFARHAAAAVRVGVAASGRTLTFNTHAGFEDQVAGYEGSVVPGASVVAELYPLAFGNPSGGLAGLGVTAAYDQVFGLKSEINGMEYNTSQSRFDVGLTYRLNFGKSATSPTLNLGVGYGQLAFAIDKPDGLVELPDVTYTYITPGASIRLPLGTARFALLAGGKFLVVTGTGDMGQASGGYGDAPVIGLDAEGGFEFRVTKRIPVQLTARYQRMAYDFNGVTGDLVQNGDDQDDVGGALDVYLGGQITLGYLF